MTQTFSYARKYRAHRSKWTILIGICLVGAATSSLPAKAQTATLAFVGSWTDKLTTEDNFSFNALVTFGGDGTATDATLLDASQYPASPGHGVWQATSPTTMSLKIEKIITDESSPAYDGMEVTTGTVTLTGANTFKVLGTLTFFTSSGAVYATLPLSGNGTRISLP